MKHYNIPVFVPHLGCPHDCVFCNQKRITGSNSAVNAKEIIDNYLDNVKPDGYVEIAFFGGSFTGIDFQEQCRFLEIAKSYIDLKIVDGIRISTRPDYINREILDNLHKFGVTTIELGVQSLDKDVLKASNRGHSAEDVFKAVSLIREYDFSLGLQMMTGLPCDTFDKSVETAVKISNLNPDFVRIYPTLVIRDTYLETLYNTGKYTPFSVEETVELLSKIKSIFDEKGIGIIRMGLQTTDEISPDASVVAGPYHPAIGELVWSRQYYNILKEKCKKDATYNVYCGNTEYSKVAGHKRCNIISLSEKYNITINIITVPEIEPGKLKIVEVKKDCF